MVRTPYLNDIPLYQALTLFHERLKSLGLLEITAVETIPVNEFAAGRLLAEPLFAQRCSPHYHASAMDGYALCSSETTAALPSRPVELELGAQAVMVDTGDPLPNWADAVVPVEDAELLDAPGNALGGEETGEGVKICLRQPILPWEHVRAVGEDLIQGQLIFPAGEVLRAADLGAVAAGGIRQLRVVNIPRVSVLPTGDELVPLEINPQSGEISEFNSVLLAAQLRGWGAEVERFPIIRDKREDLKHTLIEAAERSDLVLVNAGSSAGREDYTAVVIEEFGEVLVHGVAVRPGHPVILGVLHTQTAGIDRWVPVIGVPGYPVSTVMTAEIFVKPLLMRWTGRMGQVGETLQAVLTRKLTSPAGDDDYIRVILGSVNDRLLAAPIARGAGVTTSLAKADGILVVPRFTQGLEAGEKVKIQLMRSQEDIARNLITIGSHDLTLEILAQFLMRFGIRLVSSNVGSLGGLISLHRGECHFSGSHLLDPQSGTYNDVDIRKIFKKVEVTVMRWVRREQGLLVLKQNPKRINQLADLVRQDVNFVNRQRGAGTRVLLDYELGKAGIDPDQIHGYEMEEFTHLGVAVAVSSGRADCGLGIAAAAKALDLDFLPLFEETYELVLMKGTQDEERLKPLFEIADMKEFRKEITALPGYRIEDIGETRVIAAVKDNSRLEEK
jgi:putative molybdopterin biosynthesis protein